jgi:hypothetical protein
MSDSSVLRPLNQLLFFSFTLATSWRAEARFLTRSRDFLSQTGSGAHPTSFPVVTGWFSPNVKRLEHEVYHLHPGLQ